MPESIVLPATAAAVVLEMSIRLIVSPWASVTPLPPLLLSDGFVVPLPLSRVTLPTPYPDGERRRLRLRRPSGGAAGVARANRATAPAAAAPRSFNRRQRLSHKSLLRRRVRPVWVRPSSHSLL